MLSSLSLQRGFELSLIVLFGLGLVFLFSASYYFSFVWYHSPYHIITRQIFWALLSLLAMGALYHVPFTVFRKLSFFLVVFFFVLCLVPAIPHIGRRLGGAARWIALGPLSAQPSEGAKLVLILYASFMLALGRSEIPVLVVLSLYALVIAVIQTDFSTALILFVTVVTMIYLARGLSKALAVYLGVSLVSFFLLVLSKPYRLRRILSWITPASGPQQDNYQSLIASKALALGGFFGRGAGQSQMKLGYLPSAHADFIAAVFGEEMGFLGVVLLMALYGVLIAVIFMMAPRAVTKAERFFLCGAGSLLAFEVLANLSVVAHLLPATGLPLPLFSTGGSNLFLTGAVAGICLRIFARARLNSRRPL